MAHQSITGIGDEWRTRIRDKCNSASTLKTSINAMQCSLVTVIVVGNGGGIYREKLQQPLAVPGILCGYEVRLLQDFYCAL
jgi:hypothetical protein